ncbi:unnamed protein product [Clonostachys rosea f. rosea IK726]|uniref:Uncharacterized protein n=1 Tax=Clonostachys rosea f. rosea IK726 TaxID=1349383 RepID=A0ACA9UFZ6_BIOOC|nr:unnamed protein product [Clonostachys rosea f. rosea IK726]
MVDTLLESLFTDRSSIGPTGLTPLASYINRGGRSIELLQLIHRYMPSEAYTMFDGSGQTPMHHLVIDGNNQRSRELLEELARLHPRVLVQDNAMGQLPIELAWTLYLRHQTREAPSMHYRYFELSTGQTQPEKAVRDRPSFVGENDSTITTYRVLRALTEKAKAAGDVSQRFMISVKDAREVARRLSSRTTGEGSRNTEWDEVTRWH